MKIIKVVLLLATSILTVTAKASVASSFEIIRLNLTQLYSNQILKRYSRPLEIQFTKDEKPRGVFRPYPELSSSGLDEIGNGYVIVGVSAGYLKRDNFSEGQLLFILCHEIGHGLAGGKKKLRTYRRDLEVKKSFVEGEADYFAVKCINNYISEFGYPKDFRLGSFEIDIQTACNLSTDPSHCGYILYSSAHALEGGRREDIMYTNISETKVSSTNSYHPDPQCRLDTIKASYFNRSKPRCWHSWLPPRY